MANVITNADILFSKTRRIDIETSLEDEDVTSLIPMLDDRGNTLLHHWAYHDNLQNLAIFIEYEHKYNPELPPQTQTPDYKNKAIREWVNATNNEGFTAAHYASNIGNLDMLIFLREQGANLRACSSHDLNLLHMAAQGDKLNTIIWLSDLIELDSKDQCGLTSLHWAAQMGSESVVDYLLAKHVSINDRNKEGETPLYIASKEGQTKIVRKLLIKGADREILNHEGLRPIDIATEYDFHTIKKMLNDKYGLMDYAKFYLNTQVKYSPQSRNLWMPLVFVFTTCFVVISSHLLVKPPFLQGFLYLVAPSIYYSILLGLYFSLLTPPKPLGSPSDFKSLIRKLPICSQCRIPKIERSFHCYICGNCIQQYDHHCPWINNCVGKRNIAKFVLFLLLLVIALVECCALGFFGVMNEQWMSPLKIFHQGIWREVRLGILIASLTITLLFVLPLSYLLYIQCSNLLLNKTTFERFTKTGKTPIKFSTLGSSQHSLLESLEEADAYSFRNCSVMCGPTPLRPEYSNLRSQEELEI